MKEFLKGCLERLESLTGIRQLFYLQSDPDGKQKIEWVIEGMLEVSKKFDYIPEEMQKKYILQEMKEDQQYDALNSRTLWKWLDRHKSKHYIESPEFEVITPEKQKEYDEAAAKWGPIAIEMIQNVGKQVPQLTPEEIQNEGKLRDPMLEELRAKFPKTEPRPKFIIGTRCPDCYGENLHGLKGPCPSCEGTGEINRVEIYATNREAAQKAYDATFK